MVGNYICKNLIGLNQKILCFHKGRNDDSKIANSKIDKLLRQSLTVCTLSLHFKCSLHFKWPWRVRMMLALWNVNPLYLTVGFCKQVLIRLDDDLVWTCFSLFFTCWKKTHLFFSYPDNSSWDWFNSQFNWVLDIRLSWFLFIFGWEYKGSLFNYLLRESKLFLIFKYCILCLVLLIFI